jgi:transposase
MGRDKRDVTDAEQIADLVRIGLVTRTQLMPEPYIELRRTFTEMDRLRQERARLKVLLTHQRYGLFPEFVGNWKSVDAPGVLALLRLGLTPPQIASLGGAALLQQARASSRGRRLWGHKVRQIVQKAQSTVACPHGAAAMAGEAQRIVARMDLLEEQIEVLGADLRDRLGHLEEARYLATIPGLGWLSVAGLLAEIGPIDRYRSGRQLIKLAGTNPGRRQTGASDPATEMTHRGRGRLRRMLFLTTLAAIRVNPRLREHFDHLRVRVRRRVRSASRF